MQSLFTRERAWTGSAYELLLEYEPLSAERLRAALATLWSEPTLSGCYLDHNVESDQQPRVRPSLLPQQAEQVSHLLGIASLPNDMRVACSSLVVPEDEASWIYLRVPMGSLSYGYPVGAFPFEDGKPLDWRTEIDEWLLSVARFVHAAQPFRLGLIGWIDPLQVSAADIAASGVPEERWVGYVVPSGGTLAWYPSNRGAPIAPINHENRRAT